jgi:hypothetical protein
VKSADATLFGWYVSSWRGRYRVVARWQLAPDEEPEKNPGITRAEIADWGRGSPRILYEIYQAAYLHLSPLPRSERDTTLEESLEDAFRRLLLYLLPEEEEDEVEGSGGGGGGGASSSAPPPEADPTTPPAGSSPPKDEDTPAPPPPKKDQKTWFKAIQKDEDGEPMANEDYILVDTDGVKREGKLDGDGAVYIPSILPPGNCTISFPKIHLNPRKRKK